MREKECRIFSTFYRVGNRNVKGPDNGISLFAIRGREGGPLIPYERLALDLRMISEPTAYLGDPLSGPLFSSKNASFLAHFTR